MKGFLALGLGVAALAAPAATAGPGQWSVTGSGVGTGVLATDHVQVGAHSDAGGANPRGHGEFQGVLTGTSSVSNDGGPVVCLRVEGNRAVVVWKLRTPQTAPGFVGEFGAVYVEDNGPPAGGQPVDRMVDFSLRPATAERFCTTDFGFLLGAAFAEPLASGNFVVSDG